VLRPDPEYYRSSGPLSDEHSGVNELWFGFVPQTPFLPHPGRLSVGTSARADQYNR
ncbi:hypothetical protein ALC57_06651, partial [Trachymyrmex cornetzi]